jgi:RNA polymerase sigma-70 factor (ECF subfamily)
MNEDELDRMCVERCLAGETNAFEGILDRYERPVYNAIVRMGADSEEARDLCQQVFVKAFQHLDSYDPTRKFFSWLYRVAVNETINAIKAHRAWEPLSDAMRAASANPEEAMEAAEQHVEMQRALTALDVKYRLAIIVCHFLQLSYDEAAEVLAVPVKTVKSRLFTARQMLREILEDGRAR